MTDPIPARLAALKTTPTPDLKQQWRDLFDSEPPPFNRRYLESRLAYRIQELAYGGLKPETMKRLQELGDEIGTETAPGRRRRQEGLPNAERHGVNLLELDEDALQQVRGAQIAMIFQEPMTSLNPVFTIGSQITEVLRRHRRLTFRAAGRGFGWLGRRCTC